MSPIKNVVRITALSAITPIVTLDEAKLHLRVEESADDSLITRIVAAATRHLEALCWSSFISTTYEMILDGFPICDVIHLARGPLQSVASVKFYDPDGVDQTFDASAYWVDTNAQPGQVKLKPTKSWPSIEEGRPDAVRIRFTVGYPDAASVPESIKQAVLLLVAHMYENREPEVVGTITARFALGIAELISPHRLSRF